MLRQRDFGPYLIGNLISNSGTFCQSIALSLLVYHLTGSSLWVGIANFVQFAAILVLAPWTGSAADRVDRRRLLLATQVGALAISGALAFLAAGRLPSLTGVLGLAGLLGITSAYAFPAQKALVVTLVMPEDLHHAVTLDSISMNLSKALGPLAGALIVERLGVSWAFGLNGLSYVAMIAALMVVRPRVGVVSARRVGLRESLAELRGRPVVVALLAVVAAVAIAQDPATTLAPAFGAQVYHGSATLAGPILGVFGLGASVGGFACRRPATRPGRRLLLLLLLMALGMVAFAASQTLTAGLAGLGVAGFGYLAAQSLATTLLHENVAEGERGRIMALWSVAFIGSRPIASLADGLLSTLVGLRLAVLAMALPLLVVLVFAGRVVDAGAAGVAPGAG